MKRMGLCTIWFTSTDDKWYKENWEKMKEGNEFYEIMMFEAFLE